MYIWPQLFHFCPSYLFYLNVCIVVSVCWFSNVIEGEKMPEEWRRDLLLCIKDKGDVHICSIYVRTRLMSHMMKDW